jgi:hypothetical protein
VEGANIVRRRIDNADINVALSNISVSAVPIPLVFQR